MLKGLILGAMGVVLAAGCTMTPATNDIPVDRRVTLAADLADDMVVTDLRCVSGLRSHLGRFATTFPIRTRSWR